MKTIGPVTKMQPASLAMVDLELQLRQGGYGTRTKIANEPGLTAASVR